MRDLIIVGGGPAGLTAAIHAASEGLSVAVLEPRTVGGQAARSTAIENYPGFLAPVPGDHLGDLFRTQAEKFGASVLPLEAAYLLTIETAACGVRATTGLSIPGRAVVLACGVSYRLMDVPNCERYKGRGLHYSATVSEANQCPESEVAVVGGGNSAGQAALYLCQRAKRTHLLLRDGACCNSMSAYLAKRIEGHEHIVVHTGVEVAGLGGDDRLRIVYLRDRRTGEESVLPCNHLFCFIGATPRTAWLKGAVDLEPPGYIIAETTQCEMGEWRKLPYETSRQGVFAIGDVRAGSVKRLAAAVGEGAAVVPSIHSYLESLKHAGAV